MSPSLFAITQKLWALEWCQCCQMFLGRCGVKLCEWFAYKQFLNMYKWEPKKWLFLLVCKQRFLNLLCSGHKNDPQRSPKCYFWYRHIFVCISSIIVDCGKFLCNIYCVTLILVKAPKRGKKGQNSNIKTTTSLSIDNSKFNYICQQ